MSSLLYLIRHGQATLGLETYDNLADHGRLQSERLARYLGDRGIVFDAVYTGTLRRQRHTARIVAEHYEKLGMPFPEPVVEPGLDEIDFLSLMREISPRMQEEDPGFDRLVVRTLESFRDDSPARYKLFGKYYTAVFAAWVEERYPGLEVITWEGFREKVLSTLDVLKRHGDGEKLAAFSSGTPMGLFVQKALDLPYEKLTQVVAALYNTNVTTFLLNDGDLVLDSLNVTAHLAEGEATRY